MRKLNFGLAVLIIAWAISIISSCESPTSVHKPTDTPIAPPPVTPEVSMGTPTVTRTPTPTDTPIAPPPPPATNIPTATPTVTPIAPPPPPATNTPTATPTATPIAPPPTSMDMVYVPAGEFIMGSSGAEVDYALQLCNEYYGDCQWEWFGDEQPQHTVYLDAFYIDKTEVTNAQYRQCVEARVCQLPTTCHWGEPTYGDEFKALHSVVCVNWHDARTYCEWAGARLPTEAEWEKAARGIDGRTYPWGEGIDCEHAQYGGCGRGTVPVGSKPKGASPYGALDMAGNVWEWVADWYDKGYYSQSPTRNPPGPDSGELRVLRGGSWLDDRDYARCMARSWYDPRIRVDDVGFRCAKSSP